MPSMPLGLRRARSRAAMLLAGVVAGAVLTGCAAIEPEAIDPLLTATAYDDYSAPESHPTQHVSRAESSRPNKAPRKSPEKRESKRKDAEKAAGQLAEESAVESQVAQRDQHLAKLRKLARAAQNAANQTAVDASAGAPFSFRVATLNVLGHSHTAPGGDRKGWASSQTRMGWQLGLLNSQGVDVVGLQEFQTPQYNSMMSMAGGSWDVYPGLSQGHRVVENSIAWRSGTWELVEAHMISIPYFRGNMIPHPYIKLRHRSSGGQVWVANFHNPADVHGPAAAHRARAVAIEASLANQLSADGTPVVITGDMNDRSTYYCQMTSQSSMRAAQPDGNPSPCQPPRAMPVDWLMGSPNVNWSGWAAINNGVLGRMTDHPLVVATASIG